MSIQDIASHGSFFGTVMSACVRASFCPLWVIIVYAIQAAPPKSLLIKALMKTHTQALCDMTRQASGWSL